VDRSPLQLALRELQATFSSPHALVAMAAIIVVLGLSGPFNTFAEFGLAQRLVYWFAVVVLTFAAGRFTATVALTLIGDRIVGRNWRLLATGLICGAPVTAVVLIINAVVFNGRPGVDPLVLWLYCTAIVIAVLFVLAAARRRPAAAVAAGPDATGEPPRILERVPHPQRGKLLALSVQDHYVEVITEKGRTLVLMRLADAMRETGAVAGVQIHRSHWVALDAVKRVVRAEGKVAVELPGGDRLPVSRGFLPAARAAGLVV